MNTLTAQRLTGKVSIITGAAQGIGLATALEFAKEGANVVVCDVRQSGVDEAVAPMQSFGRFSRRLGGRCDPT